MTAIDCPKGHRTLAMYYRKAGSSTLMAVTGWRYCPYCDVCYRVSECVVLKKGK